MSDEYPIHLQAFRTLDLHGEEVVQRFLKDEQLKKSLVLGIGRLMKEGVVDFEQVVKIGEAITCPSPSVSSSASLDAPGDEKNERAPLVRGSTLTIDDENGPSQPSLSRKNSTPAACSAAQLHPVLSESLHSGGGGSTPSAAVCIERASFGREKSASSTPSRLPLTPLSVPLPVTSGEEDGTSISMKDREREKEREGPTPNAATSTPVSRFEDRAMAPLSPSAGEREKKPEASPRLVSRSSISTAAPLSAPSSIVAEEFVDASQPPCVGVEAGDREKAQAGGAQSDKAGDGGKVAAEEDMDMKSPGARLEKRPRPQGPCDFPEVVLQILSFLSFGDAVMAAAACRFWQLCSRQPGGISSVEFSNRDEFNRLLGQTPSGTLRTLLHRRARWASRLVIVPQGTSWGTTDSAAERHIPLLLRRFQSLQVLELSSSVPYLSEEIEELLSSNKRTLQFVDLSAGLLSVTASIPGDLFESLVYLRLCDDWWRVRFQEGFRCPNLMYLGVRCPPNQRMMPSDWSNWLRELKQLRRLIILVDPEDTLDDAEADAAGDEVERNRGLLRQEAPFALQLLKALPSEALDNLVEIRLLDFSGPSALDWVIQRALSDGGKSFSTLREISAGSSTAIQRRKLGRLGFRVESQGRDEALVFRRDAVPSPEEVNMGLEREDSSEVEDENDEWAELARLSGIPRIPPRFLARRGGRGGTGAPPPTPAEAVSAAESSPPSSQSWDSVETATEQWTSDEEEVNGGEEGEREGGAHSELSSDREEDRRLRQWAFGTVRVPPHPPSVSDADSEEPSGPQSDDNDGAGSEDEESNGNSNASSSTGETGALPDIQQQALRSTRRQIRLLREWLNESRRAVAAVSGSFPSLSNPTTTGAAPASASTDLPASAPAQTTAEEERQGQARRGPVSLLQANPLLNTTTDLPLPPRPPTRRQRDSLSPEGGSMALLGGGGGADFPFPPARTGGILATVEEEGEVEAADPSREETRQDDEVAMYVEAALQNVDRLRRHHAQQREESLRALRRLRRRRERQTETQTGRRRRDGETQTATATEASGRQQSRRSDGPLVQTLLLPVVENLLSAPSAPSPASSPHTPSLPEAPSAPAHAAASSSSSSSSQVADGGRQRRTGGGSGSPSNASVGSSEGESGGVIAGFDEDEMDVSAFLDT
uniref:F-box domain-containing protein n=1 Tax=Chromera velia CCMP2878 TaxID=1169474 RepID=A0A0G4I0I5_9ALVE|eukprot:Cvel_9939.t1-p1 / transcript=Cvel_9939.t1 / gene=Cvel_9939 / organism=Chromera_velia_CCMP2878 / gene_product=hypothetical protein / transcript_product=hypothetical protein / location=Cvel_scaffold588:26280-31722(+) / protein_length=1164 / sequence_SO=supercontig / SO=protein_coding / is_pseudo=false